MSKLLYFAYGSNLHPNWLKSRTPSAQMLGIASLTGYRLMFNKAGLDDSGKCNIVATGNETEMIHGVVYEFPLHEKGVLDQAELGYQQERIEIGEYSEVLVYLCGESTLEDKAPYSWYRDIVLAGATLHGFPDHYLEHIGSFSAKNDPDQQREQRFRKIVWP